MVEVRLVKYENMVKGIFIHRPNRFLAQVQLDGGVETVHVKNTGRCAELLVPGSTVYLEKAKNPNRKTGYSLISVEKKLGDGSSFLVNMDSQVPNYVVEERLRSCGLDEIGKIEVLKREAARGKSRFDFYYETQNAKGYIEVKGVTLEEDGISRFPDAPTQRGRRHVEELEKLQKEGYRNFVFFLVQMKYPRIFAPNDGTDPDFGKALRCAKESGVGILCYDALVQPNSIIMDMPLSIDL